MDDPLLAKILTSVKLEVILPVRIRVSKHIKGKETDSHIFEFHVTDDVKEIQSEVVKIARQWKGRFEVGTQFIVERLE